MTDIKIELEDLEPIEINILSPELIEIDDDLDIKITEYFTTSEENFIDMSILEQITFIDEKVQETRERVQQEISTFKNDLQNVMSQIKILDEDSPIDNRIENIKDIEERLRILRLMLKKSKLSNDEKSRINKEISILEGKIRQIYENLVKILTFDNFETDDEEEVKIRVNKSGNVSKVIKVDLEDFEKSGIRKERLPDGSFIVGIEEIEKVRDSYKVEFAKGIFEKNN